MSRLRVVCTLPDGRVAILVPAPDFIEECRVGIVAARAARGYAQEPLDETYEAGKFVADPSWRGDLPHAAREALALQRVRALNRGGLTEQDAVALVRDCDAPAFSTAREIVDVSEIPSDRTYRDAWRRSPNGGPIVIDQNAARAIRDERLVQIQRGAA
jgi:hypothetical protein